MRSLTVGDVMTPVPITVDEDSDLVVARKILRENKIRHLPVTHRGRLTGILSDRDIKLIALLPDIEKIRVADIMTRHPFTVPEQMPVLEGILKMAKNKYGCLIAKRPNGEVAGIFTTQDALNLILQEAGHEIPEREDRPYPQCEDEGVDACDIDDDIS